MANDPFVIPHKDIDSNYTKATNRFSYCVNNKNG